MVLYLEQTCQQVNIENWQKLVIISERTKEGKYKKKIVPVSHLRIHPEEPNTKENCKDVVRFWYIKERHEWYNYQLVTNEGNLEGVTKNHKKYECCW